MACHWSDIVTFHNYGGPEALEKEIVDLKRHGRPVDLHRMAEPRHGFHSGGLPASIPA